jgi:hypothetical protein
MAATKAPPPLLSHDLEELIGLVRDADSVELKLTVPDEDRFSTQATLGIDPLAARLRQIWFFDTPDLTLDSAGVVVRARRTQNAPDDTVVKLRPVIPAELPARLRAREEFVVEVDTMPGSYVCSGSFKGRAKIDVRDALADGASVRKLFSKRQREFFAQHAPEGLELDDLTALGPVNALKLKVAPKALSHKLAVELWLYPDGSRILELSTRCAPRDLLDTATQTREFLRAQGVDVSGEQATKTRKALGYFSELAV